jgi:hypothetical protein
MAAHNNHSTGELVMQVMEALITQQQGKVVACAAGIDPRLTADDLLQPHDFPALGRDPAFNYEDGLLAGLRSARAALRAALARAAVVIGAAL